MFDFLWAAIMEIADDTDVRIPAKEKYSAGALGACYAIKAYKKSYGSEHVYIKECIKGAIEKEKCKRNRRYLLESDFSLDMKIDENGTEAKEFVRSKDKSAEKQVVLSDFIDTLDDDGKHAAKLLSCGATAQDLQEMLGKSEEDIEELLEEIREEYLDYYDERGSETARG